MPRQSVILVVFIIASSLLNCRGADGPVGPPGAPGEGGGVGSLTDPAIKPKVLYTFPPANTVGPYEHMSDGYNEIQFRFNKFMERASIDDAVKLSSPNTKVHVDTAFLTSLGGDLWLAYPFDSLLAYHYYRWHVGETYRLDISSAAKDVNGNTLNPPFSMTFEPEPFFRIVRVDPPPGVSEVQTFAKIRIYFNSNVDTSTFSRIHITPPIHGRWQYDYGYGYPDSSAISFSASPHGNNTTYTITVDAAARDVDGHTLQQGFVSSFTTVAFRVSSSSPGDGEGGVAPFSLISVAFTAPADTGTVRAAFSISPNILGNLSPWSNGKGFSFNAIPQLAPETSYTVRIDTSIRSIDGVRLSPPYRFSFTIAPFMVRETSPSDGEMGIDRQVTVIIYSNGVIDDSTVRSSFALKDSTGVTVGGSINIFVPNTSFGFVPSMLLAPNAWYMGTVSIGLKALGGGPLKSEFIFSFRTGN